MSDIIVVLSSQPKSIKNSKKTFDSLEKQTLKPDIIYWFYPYRSKRFNIDYPEVPDWTTKYKNLKVIRCEDNGPATKIIPLLDLNIKDDKKIVIIDDDAEYPENAIELLNENFKPGIGLGYFGSIREYLPNNLIVSGPAFKTKGISWINRVNVMLCSNMVMYPRSMYPKNSQSYLDDMKKIKNSFLNDDFMNTYYADKNKIKLYLIYNQKHKNNFKEEKQEGKLTGLNFPHKTFIDLIWKGNKCIPKIFIILFFILVISMFIIFKKLIKYTININS